ncbi:putative peptidoglycan lipid II flippase [Nocardia pseudobrasiliensis]|uniref:Putative peptidoglycan lipid II flippase n=2 Tax=Nocardia pseudobrasiliensis TaxID=45979 RepID=A0A370HT65_9NOCA|nr:putative peptidoglycan lipid II flippase [Nocardia pseudobrasiliensis]
MRQVPPNQGPPNGTMRQDPANQGPAGGAIRQDPPSQGPANGAMRQTPPPGPPSGAMRQVPPRPMPPAGPNQAPPQGSRRHAPPGGPDAVAPGDPTRQVSIHGPRNAPPSEPIRRVPGGVNQAPPSGPMRRVPPGPPRQAAPDGWSDDPQSVPSRPQPPRGPRERSYPPGPPSGPQPHLPPRAPRPEPRPLPRHLPGGEPAPRRAGRAGPARTAQQVAIKPIERPQGSTSRLLSASGSIAIATLMSRITGFGKQLLLLTVLGPAIASAFTVASQIPTMVEQLVLGAVLTAFVVPTLVRAEKEDIDGGAAFVRRLVTMAFTVLGTAALLCTAASPLLIKYVFLSDSGKVSTGLTTALAFLLVPAILFYGMSSLLMAILNTHEIFKPGAWAPVLNNLVALAVLGLYAVTPGEISLDPVRMGQPKLLILGLGITTGVFVQVASLLPAIRRAGIDLRPLWGFDERLKQFGGMGLAVILYVLISQAGFVFGTRISSHADVAGPAIYQNAWLLLQLPYGVLGVTLLTAIMPRLSRNAASDDTPAVVDDLSVATRLTMIAFVPVVTFLTIAGPQIGQALYGYGNFGAGDAGRLGEAVSWSAFTLIPYALVLIHLRVFYAREQAWTPTWIILGITAVKIVLSALAPVLFSDDHVVIALGVANGLGFVAGAIIGGWLLHRSLGDLRMANVGRTITRVVLASVAGAAVTLIVEQVLGLPRLHGGVGAIFRVGLDAVVMFGVAFGLMRLAGVPEVVAITVSISRRLGITPPAPDLGLDGGAAADIEATTVLPRPELDTPYYYRYDPYMDAQTMVLPVIRPGTVDRPGMGEFPYPVPQRNANSAIGSREDADAGVSSEPNYGRTGVEPGTVPPSRTSIYQGEGGTKVSDDAAGGVPAADAAAEAAGSVRTDDVPPDQVPPADRADDTEPDDGDEHAEQADSASPAGPDRPARDQTYDTGMLPVASPEMPPMRVEPPNKRTPRGPKLIPGASVAGGRYRLLAGHGGARGLKFWQALDVKLDREVALTFVDADQKSTDNAGHDGPQAILSRTLRLGRINSPGLARVLDVVRGSSGGIVVAEWTPGRSLREMAETVPSPIGAARAIRALAAAAELAHRGGGSLSIDHPDRIRISASGDAVLAFPGTLSDSDAQSDVRGLGAMLYALITARWPIRSGGVSGTAATVGGLRPADFGADGTPVEPRQIRPEVPFEISAVAVRSLESNKGVRTAATVQHVLEQASVVDQKTDFIPVLRLGQRASSAPDESLADPELLAAERERSQRMMWMLVGLGVLAALVVGVIIWWALSIFAPSSSEAPLDEQRKLGLTTANVAPQEPTAGGSSSSAPAVAGAPVPVTGVSVFSPEGTPDGTGAVNAVIGGDPGKVWHTDQYFQQFPALKKGVGILATLGSPSKLSKVTITSPSPGTVVEIRTSPTASPTLDQTQLVGQATLADGATDIPVRADQPGRYVLVWITALANNGGQFQSSIANIRFEAAP